ncbi:zinc finger protein 606 isoform X6 [Equus caballus]|uniref:zinc finger protein 606 isoform X6 n=1 Tax=Equus caballus TaxID=9796 RepID=UPI0038B2CD57
MVALPKSDRAAWNYNSQQPARHVLVDAGGAAAIVRGGGRAGLPGAPQGRASAQNKSPGACRVACGERGREPRADAQWRQDRAQRRRRCGIRPACFGLGAGPAPRRPGGRPRASYTLPEPESLPVVLQLLSAHHRIHCCWAGACLVNPVGWRPSTRGPPGVSLQMSPGRWQLSTHGCPGVSQEPVSPLATLAAMSWPLPAVICHCPGSEPGNQLCALKTLRGVWRKLPRKGGRLPGS